MGRPRDTPPDRAIQPGVPWPVGALGRTDRLGGRVTDDQAAGDQAAGEQATGDQAAGDQAAGDQAARDPPVRDQAAWADVAPLAWVASAAGRVRVAKAKAAPTSVAAKPPSRVAGAGKVRPSAASSE